MALTIQDVEAVAGLARIALSADEKQALRDQISGILDHIAVLDQLDTAAIPPTAQVIPLKNFLRDDVAGPCLPQEVALANAPRQESGFFEVSAVLGSDSTPSA